MATLSVAAAAQERVRFPSLDGKNGEQPTELDGYLFRPERGDDPFPMVIFQHGCGGLFSTTTHRITSRERDWADRFNSRGIGVLMVDSFTPRGSTGMCSHSSFKEWIYLRRPADAYGALVYLQKQPFVARDRIALMGWSNGGGSVLYAVGRRSLGRPADFGGPDFQAAIAFYPGSCSEKRLGADWSTSIPLLILVGEADVWTPAEPCRQVAEQAVARGAPVEFHAYPGAYHDFDWPGMKRHEVPAFTTRDGVVPIEGEDPAARADAIRRVDAFLADHLLH
ncbi:dienelactone hydrolase family protein [Enhydrobacter aerosaccus]|uniref:dienelactone hydrolase family protein n=1 Tax=Enhydrobacter aerosaccus TaxID=225324 RepID=UPI001C46D2D7|nr:dienelactone hydrolase family protein [Enhydrobacter aerosaccus]